MKASLMAQKRILPHPLYSRILTRTDVIVTQEQKTIISSELQRFLEEELDVSIGSFESADLADFVIHQIGPWMYNQGVLDARAKLSNTVDGILDELALLEKPSPLER